MLASELLTKEILTSQSPVRDVHMQGDILPLIKHLAFAGRLRRTDLQSTVDAIRRKQARYSARGKWIHRPREANIVADYLAGEASKLARQVALTTRAITKRMLLSRLPRSSTSLNSPIEIWVKLAVSWLPLHTGSTETKWQPTWQLQLAFPELGWRWNTHQFL